MCLGVLVLQELDIQNLDGAFNSCVTESSKEARICFSVQWILIFWACLDWGLFSEVTQSLLFHTSQCWCSECQGKSVMEKWNLINWIKLTESHMISGRCWSAGRQLKFHTEWLFHYFFGFFSNVSVFSSLNTCTSISGQTNKRSSMLFPGST